MIWYNDDDIEKKQTNWKNSEVTRLFVENYLDPMLVKEAQEAQEAQDLENDCGDEEIVILVTEEEDEAEPPLLKEEFLYDIDVAIRKLAVLAKQSDNEIVRYKIERAIIDLEAKKQGD
jgi:hypothetical protein